MKSKPEYGIVRWYDATGLSVGKTLPTRKKAQIMESIGMTFRNQDGAIIVLHERMLGETGMQRRAEVTIIPGDWVKEFIKLVPEESA